MQRFIALLVGGWLPLLAQAAEIPLMDENGPFESIAVRGVAAQLTYSAVGNARVFSIKDPLPSGWRVERRGTQLWLEGPEPETSEQMTALLSGSPSRVTIDMSGPSRPLDVRLRDGHVTVSRLTHPVRADVQTGRFSALQLAGGLRLTGRSLEVTAQDGGGPWSVDLFKGSFSAKNLNANADLRVFQGSVNLDRGSGTLALLSYSGSTKVQRFNGALRIEQQKGSVSAQGIQGRVEGDLGDANATLQVLNESEVNLRAEGGKIVVQLPAQSGAALNLATNGDLVTPSDVKVQRGAQQKMARGRLSGPGHLQVTVRSGDGTIIVK